MRIQVEPSDELQDYVAQMSLREPQVLAELREETSRLPLHLMQISPEQGQFLRLLVRAFGVRRAVEVGVFTGYSLLCTALGMPADGSVVACDVDEEWAAMAMRYAKRAGVADKIDLRIGDARATLRHLIDDEGLAGTVDFVFIDADKEGYEEYYERGLTLLRPGGLLLVDNVLWHGAVINDEVQDSETRALRAFNAKVRDDDRVDLSMIPYADGLTFALKR